MIFSVTQLFSIDAYAQKYLFANPYARCPKSLDFLACRALVEPSVCAASGRLCKRDGERLIVYRRNAKPEVVSDFIPKVDSDQAKVKWTRYEGYSSKWDFHLLQVQLYEGDYLIAVPNAELSQVTLNGKPIPSPDNKFFVTVSGDESEYNPNLIAFYKKSSTGFVRDWYYEPK
jgi:hypothetical protein